MKKLIACFVLPLSAALLTAILLVRLNIFPTQPKPSSPEKFQNTPGIYIDKFENDPELENLLFEESDGNTINIFGSSELSHSGPAAPQKFIPLHSPFRVRTFGHAGNQCLSILCQLLAKEKQIKDSKMVIILSPGWFESKAALGTSSKVFLEYNSENMLKNWQANSQEEAIYARKRMAGFFKDFNSPGRELKKQFFQSRSEISFLHSIALQPLITSLQLIEQFNGEKSKESKTKRPIQSLKANEFTSPDWDSLFTQSAAEVKSKSTNNSLGINDEYFSNHIGNKRGKIQAVPLYLNTELNDFKHLLKFIAGNKWNACFIISPMNALYYENLEELNPVMAEIEKDIKKAGIPLLNFFNSNKENYQKEMLSDVMHLSDYGWYKTNRFIIENFQKKH